MKKSDLKSGMKVVTREGGVYIVFINSLAGDIVLSSENNGWFLLTYHGSNLLYAKNSNLDIIKVYGNSFPDQYLRDKFSERYLLWERKEEKTILSLDGVDYSKTTLRSLIKKATQ